MTQEFDTPTGLDRPSAEPPVDVSAAVAAQVFGNVPLVGPDWLRSSIVMQANFAQLLPGATSANSADLNGPRNRAEREDDEAKAKADRMATVVEEVARQREEWARTTHTFAGTTTMTGREWETMSEELREGGPLRQWLLARIMADGHTREEAERLTDRVTNVSQIMSIPESQRTADQRRELADAERDPEVRQYVDAAARQSQEMHGPDMTRNAVVASADQAASVDARANAMGDFPNAPNLGAEFQLAQAATVPLDQQRITASQSTAPVAGRVLASGFEI